VNPCTPFSSHKNIVDPDKCSSPSPAPIPPLPPAPPLPKWATEVLTALLKAKNYTGVNADACVADIGRSYVLFAEFAADFGAKRFEPDAAQSLARGLTALSSAATDCNITALQAELAVLAAASRDADFSAAVWLDATSLAADIAAGDTSAIGKDLANLLGAWRAVSQGCKAGHKACQFLDRLLALLSLTAEDVAPCEAALTPAFAHFTAAASAFTAANYSTAIQSFADGLDAVAVAAATDACGLKGLADALGALSPRLRTAVVKIETSAAVHILVGSADVYDPLYRAAIDARSGNLADLGVQLGRLLVLLRASACTTPACDVLEGLLKALQIEAGDYRACAARVDAVWPQLSSAVDNLKAGKWMTAAQATGGALTALAEGVGACGLSSLGDILEDTVRRAVRFEPSGALSRRRPAGVELDGLPRSASGVRSLAQSDLRAPNRAGYAAQPHLDRAADWGRGHGAHRGCRPHARPEPTPGRRQGGSMELRWIRPRQLGLVAQADQLHVVRLHHARGLVGRRRHSLPVPHCMHRGHTRVRDGPRRGSGGVQPAQVWHGADVLGRRAPPGCVLCR
jgi:hypothetical protein